MAPGRCACDTVDAVSMRPYNDRKRDSVAVHLQK